MMSILYAIVFVPSGAIGVLLKLKTPSSCSYADNLWLILDVLNIFKVCPACSNSWSYSFFGNDGSHPLSMEIK